MNAERLLTLAKFLHEKVPDKCWDFGNVMNFGSKEPRDAFESGGGCGTAGCAVGWSPMAFPGELEWRGGRVYEVGSSKDCGLWSMGTAERFFGLHEFNCMYLFMPASYQSRFRTTRHEVADRIEEFVRTHQPAGGEK